MGVPRKQHRVSLKHAGERAYLASSRSSWVKVESVGQSGGVGGREMVAGRSACRTLEPCQDSHVERGWLEAAQERMSGPFGIVRLTDVFGAVEAGRHAEVVRRRMCHRGGVWG